MRVRELLLKKVTTSTSSTSIPRPLSPREKEAKILLFSRIFYSNVKFQLKISFQNFQYVTPLSLPHSGPFGTERGWGEVNMIRP
jgi:hypothetical protein